MSSRIKTYVGAVAAYIVLSLASYTAIWFVPDGSTWSADIGGTADILFQPFMGHGPCCRRPEPSCGSAGECPCSSPARSCGEQSWRPHSGRFGAGRPNDRAS